MTREAVDVLLSANACQVCDVAFMLHNTQELSSGFTDKFYQVGSTLLTNSLPKLLKDFRDKHTPADQDETSCSTRSLWDCDFGGQSCSPYALLVNMSYPQASSRTSIFDHKRFGRFEEQSA
jgi:hypothetical protein